MWSQVQRESHVLPGKSPIWLLEPILQVPVSWCSATVQGLLGVQQSFASLARHSGEAACQGHIQVAAVELMGTSGRCFPLLSGFTDRGLFSTTSLSWDNVHISTQYTTKDCYFIQVQVDLPQHRCNPTDCYIKLEGWRSSFPKQVSNKVKGNPCLQNSFSASGTEVVELSYC